MTERHEYSCLAEPLPCSRSTATMNLLLAGFLFVAAAWANNEKAIFLAPAPISLPNSGPSLEALRLDTLTPKHQTLRRSLAVAFPSEAKPFGNESWYLLQHLAEGQRYELRVCWAATVRRFTSALGDGVKRVHALIQGIARDDTRSRSLQRDARS